MIFVAVDAAAEVATLAANVAAIVAPATGSAIVVAARQVLVVVIIVYPTTFSSVSILAGRRGFGNLFGHHTQDR